MDRRVCLFRKTRNSEKRRKKNYEEINVTSGTHTLIQIYFVIFFLLQYNVCIHDVISIGFYCCIFTTRRAIFGRPFVRHLFIPVVEQMILKTKRTTRK